MTEKINKEKLDKALKDSIWCSKCKAKLKWEKSIAEAELNGKNKVRCHKCNNIIGYINVGIF